MPKSCECPQWVVDSTNRCMEPAVDFRNRDFIQLVKRTREKFGVSIDEAHDMICADEELRRLIAWRANHDQECRKQALWVMRHKCDQSRFPGDCYRIVF